MENTEVIKKECKEASVSRERPSYGKEWKQKGQQQKSMRVVKRGSGRHFGSFSIFPGGLPELSMPQSASKKLFDWR